jgi:hypothetical protein
MGQVEVPVGVGGADDPVRAPRNDEQHRLLGAQNDRHLAHDAVARNDDVHALGRPHPKSPTLLRQRLDLVGPHAGGVHHHVPAHLGHTAIFGVTHLDPDDPVTFAQQRHDLRRRPHDRSVVRRSTSHGHGVARVVNDGVVVADTADQRRPLQAGSQPQRTGLRQMLLRRNGIRSTELVV